MWSFWKKNNDTIAIIAKKGIYYIITIQKISHKNWIFSKYNMHFRYLQQFFFKIKHQNALCLFGANWSFPGLVNICYLLPDGQVVEKVNFDPWKKYMCNDFCLMVNNETCRAVRLKIDCLRAFCDATKAKKLLDVLEMQSAWSKSTYSTNSKGSGYFSTSGKMHHAILALEAK